MRLCCLAYMLRQNNSHDDDELQDAVTLFLKFQVEEFLYRIEPGDDTLLSCVNAETKQQS